MPPLQKQTIQIPLAAGVSTKLNDKLVGLGQNLTSDNVDLDETGKVRKRSGFRPIGSTLNGYSTTTDSEIGKIHALYASPEVGLVLHCTPKRLNASLDGILGEAYFTLMTAERSEKSTPV